MKITAIILLVISLLNIATFLWIAFDCNRKKVQGCIHGLMLFPAFILLPLSFLLFIIDYFVS